MSFCLIQHIQECFVHSCIQRAVDLPALEHSSILADCRKRFIHLLQAIAPFSDSMIKCNRSLSAVREQLKGTKAILVYKLCHRNSLRFLYCYRIISNFSAM